MYKIVFLVFFLAFGFSHNKVYANVCERVFASLKSYLPLSRRADIYFTEADSLVVYRVKKVKQENQKGFLVDVELLNPIRGKVQTLEVFIHKDPELPFEVDPFYSFSPKLPPQYVHFDMKVVFESARLKRKTVNMADVLLSPRTNKEAELKEQGYEPFYRKGIDDLNEWVEVRKALEAFRANPWTTHIEYFANKVKSHLDFFTKALEPSMNEAQKQALAKLTEDAQKAVKKKKVTYQWWVFFNVRLSYVLSNREFIVKQGIFGKDGGGLTPAHISSLIAWFPVVMLVPSLLGEIGIMTFNRSLNEGVHPFGLVGKSKYVDGRERDPAMFVMHDIGHTGIFLVSQLKAMYSDGHKLRHKKMQAIMESLPVEKRKLAEVVYWIAMHESEEGILLSSKSREEIHSRLSRAVFLNMLKGGLLPQHLVKLAGISDLENTGSIVDVFMKEVYDKILSL